MKIPTNIIRNRLEKRFTRYARVYANFTIKSLNSKELTSLATGITILGAPLILKGAFDTFAPILELIKETNSQNIKILENQKKILEGIQEMKQSHKILKESMDEVIRNQVNKPWYQKLLEKLSIEVSFEPNNADDGIKELEERLKALETPPSSPMKPISKK